MKWSEISQDARYINAPANEKAFMRDSYYKDVVEKSPGYKPEYETQTRAMIFDEQKPMIESLREKPGEVRELKALPGKYTFGDRMKARYGRLRASMNRKLSIFAKEGVKGLTLDNFEIDDLPLWIDAPEKSFAKQMLKVEPATTTEKILGDVTRLGYSLIPFYYGSKLVGLGKVGMGKAAITGRAALLGGVLGAAEKPPELKEGAGIKEQVVGRGIGAAKGAAIFGGLTAGGFAAQNVLSKYSRGALLNTIKSARRNVKEVLKIGVDKLDTTKAYELLKSLPAKEQHAIFNILRGKHNMPQKIYKSWFEKNIGGPLYQSFVDKLDKVMPARVKEKFLYRVNEPEAYSKMAETRIRNLANWQDEAMEVEKTLTEGVSRAESMALLRAIKEPTQMEIIRTMRPDLYDRAILARQVIDRGSVSLADLKTLPEQTRETILDNVGSYVKRVYEKPGVERIKERFFLGRRKMREPRLLEKGKPARVRYEKGYKAELGDIKSELDYVDDIKRLEGVGDITKARLKRAGYGSVDRLAKSNPDDIRKIVGTRSKVSAENIIAQADATSKYKVRLNQRSNEVNNLLKKPVKKPDIPMEIRQKLGEVTTAGKPVKESIKTIGYKVETARLFEETAGNPMLSTSDEILGLRQGWKQMPDSIGMGSLRNKWVHPAVAKDIDGILKTTHAVDRVYQSILSAWKMGKTVMNPATHARNVMSNTMLLNMSGTPSYRIPDLLSASLDDIMNKTPLYKKLSKLGLGRSTFATGEIQALQNVYSGKTTVSEILEAGGKRFNRSAFGGMNRMYQLEEELFKIARVRYLKEQGLNLPNAMADAEKWLFNYSKIPEFIKKLRTSPLGAPFITFQYKAMPRALEAIMKRPMTILKYPLLLGAMEKYAIKKFNLKPHQVAKMKGQKPLTYILPFLDSNDNFRIFDMQYIVPYGQLFETRNVFGYELPTFGLGQNPIYSTAFNVAQANRDPFSGREVYDETARPVRTAKGNFKYMGQLLLPPLTPGIGYSFEKIQKAAEGRTDRYGMKTDYWFEVIDAIAGLKTKPVNASVEEYKRMKAQEWLFRKYSGKVSSIKRNQSLLPKERNKEIVELRKDYIYATNDLWKGIRKKVKP